MAVTPEAAGSRLVDPPTFTKKHLSFRVYRPRAAVVRGANQPGRSLPVNEWRGTMNRRSRVRRLLCNGFASGAITLDRYTRIGALGSTRTGPDRSSQGTP